MSFKFNPFTGTLDEVSAGGGGGTPGGSDTQVQFNDGGSTFGGDVDLTWNKTTNVLTVGGDVNLTDGGTYTTTLQTITPTANRTISFPDATGTVALVAGSSGQLLWNNAGAYAGASTLTYDGSILTTSGRFINSYNSGSLAPAKQFTGTWVTGQGSTNTKPHFLIEPTGTTSTAWSNSGTGLGVNAASGFGGNLLDLQINGGSVFSVFQSSGRSRLNISGGGAYASINRSGNEIIQFTTGEVGIFGSFGFHPASGLGIDTVLVRDAANTLAQRNSTNAQAFRVYNTYTSGTNYELGKLEWSSNVFRIGTEKGSGGGTARSLEFQTDGTTRLTIDTSGGLLANTASGFAGNLLDLQVNGTRYFSISKGTTNLFYANDTASTDQTTYITRYGTYGAAFFYKLGTNSGVYNFSVTQSGFLLADGAPLGFSADSGHNAASTCTLRGIPGQPILEQRGGTNAQTFRVYGTFTDANNHVRASLSSTSTAVTLAAETAGTGADNIPINLTAAGTGTVKVNSVAEVAVSSTVAGLPATPVVGMLTRVTDATSPTLGATVAGGGSAAALVWYNGTNWTVIGV